MKNRTWLKISFYVFAAVVCLFLVLVVLDRVNREESKNRLVGADKKTIRKLEAEFERQPSTELCTKIMDRYLFREDHEAVVRIGKTCLTLSGNNDMRAMLINYWMAIAFNELRQSDLAGAHLGRAIELDTVNRLHDNKADLIDKYGLALVYDSVTSRR